MAYDKKSLDTLVITFCKDLSIRVINIRRSVEYSNNPSKKKVYHANIYYENQETKH